MVLFAAADQISFVHIYLSKTLPIFLFHKSNDLPLALSSIPWVCFTALDFRIAMQIYVFRQMFSTFRYRSIINHQKPLWLSFPPTKVYNTTQWNWKMGGTHCIFLQIDRLSPRTSYIEPFLHQFWLAAFLRSSQQTGLKARTRGKVKRLESLQTTFDLVHKN